MNALEALKHRVVAKTFFEYLNDRTAIIGIQSLRVENNDGSRE